MSSFIFCSNCGTKLSSDLKFCYSCGKEIILPKNFNQNAVAAETAPAPAVSPATPSFQEPAKAEPIVPESPSLPQEQVPFQQKEQPVQNKSVVTPFSFTNGANNSQPSPVVKEPEKEQPAVEEPTVPTDARDTVTLIYRPPVSENEVPTPIVPKKEESTVASPSRESSLMANNNPAETISSTPVKESEPAPQQPVNEIPKGKILQSSFTTEETVPQTVHTQSSEPNTSAKDTSNSAPSGLDFDYIFQQANLQRNASSPVQPAPVAPKVRTKRRFDPETGLPRSKY